MPLNSVKKLLGFAAFAASVSLMAVPGAQAVPSACSSVSPDVTGDVVSNSGCQIDAALNNDAVGDVNGAGFFGITDWSFIEKNDPPVEGTGSLVTTGTTQGGTWTINGFDSNLLYLLTFKAGNVNSGVRPGVVIAYLIETATGSWTSPFFNANNNNRKDTSHISLFSTTSTPDGFDPQVPVPAALPLMLTAIGVAGFMARRRRG